MKRGAGNTWYGVLWNFIVGYGILFHCKLAFLLYMTLDRVEHIQITVQMKDIRAEHYSIRAEYYRLCMEWGADHLLD